MKQEITRAWLFEHASYSGESCLPWPFSVDSRNGRGRVFFDDKGQWAHRVMCRIAHGEPPTPTHNAAHSCGKGHEGRVNPRHLSWKTPQENTLDMRLHGTVPRRPGCSRYKLTMEKAEQIRALAGTKTQSELAEMFGVAWQNIGRILRNQAWNKELHPERNRILAALRDADGPMLAPQVQVAAGLPNVNSARCLLRTLVKVGSVKRVAPGLYQSVDAEGLNQ